MLLETRALTANYGQFRALFGVDLTLDKGETVARTVRLSMCRSSNIFSISRLLRVEMVELVTFACNDPSGLVLVNR